VRKIPLPYCNKAKYRCWLKHNDKLHRFLTSQDMEAIAVCGIQSREFFYVWDKDKEHSRCEKCCELLEIPQGVGFPEGQEYPRVFNVEC
jgi:hypothetical protein